MMKPFLRTTCIFLFFSCFQISAQEDRQLINQDKYFGFLAKAGFRPEIDSDGDIEFYYEGTRFYVITDLPLDRFRVLMFKNNNFLDGIGCSEIFYKALNDSMKAYRDGCVATVNDDCSRVIFSWNVDLPEDGQLTFEQFIDAINRLNEGLENYKTKMTAAGLLE